MTKVKLPKEVAEAIELYLVGGATKSDLLSVHGDGWWGNYEALNTIDIMTLATALVNGYEVEKTPEEAVREYYEYLNAKVLNGSIAPVREKASELHALLKTLYLLGITIEGVNAND